MNRSQILFILAMPFLFCLGLFLWQANPLYILVPLGIAGIALIGLFIAFVISAELTSFDAWDLLIRSVLFRLGFKVNPPKSLEDEHDEDHHHHEENKEQKEAQAELDLKQLLRELTIKMMAERSYIALVNQESGELEFQLGLGIDELKPLELAVAREVAQSKETVITTNAHSDPRFASSSSVAALSLRSIMAAPLIVDDKVIGVIYFDNRLQAGLFNQNQSASLNDLAEAAAIAIENARRGVVPANHLPSVLKPDMSITTEAEPVSVEESPGAASEGGEALEDEEDAFGGDFDDEFEEVIEEKKQETQLPEIVDAKPSPPKPISKPISPEESDLNTLETQFTAYYPRQAAAKTEYGFYVYAHLQDALIESDVQAFSKELGGRVPKAVVAEEKASLQEGALLSVMIHCDKLKFNQIGAMQVWKAPFVRFDFKFSADETLIDEIVEGRVAILLGMIEIASIDFKISVGAASPLAAVNALPEKPTLSLDASPSIPPYQKIFVSYSRQDTIVAEQYRSAQTMLGNTIFMDVHSIRAGEDWDVALKRFISEADVFQLFWSEYSATSDHVRMEWDYALKQRCPDTACRQFIRPTYWQKPMPQVPDELNHLHFAYVALESKTGDSL